MRRWWNDKQGSFAIVVAIVVFVGALTVTAFIDMLSRTYLLNEVQSIMDVSGTSALRTGVDEVQLRTGDFALDRDLVEANYRRMVEEQVRSLSKIVGYQFVDMDVSVFQSNFGLGQTGKPRWQGMIDSTMMIQVEASPVFDLIPGASETFYNAKNSSSFQVSYVGKTEDGKVELLVRSVTRVVYR
ncbi:hypothetical protein [Geobacillus subterraneus]|uniref:Uncharacterized protein n=1 Tax=Geobacillus subterraneus TaxID=129338 RepID=A0A679FQH9_9BACL|nr:hypothetical protein [Geobacillus subterraneus]BBW98912.1 hypothetical protein GsuE55_37450 [Geobacillus subterraneus]